jgi:acyl carrier protein
MTIQERIQAVVENVAQKRVPSDPEESLFDSGVLDSFALPDMVSAIEKEFGIKVPDADLNPRKYDSINRIVSYVENRAS